MQRRISNIAPDLKPKYECDPYTLVQISYVLLLWRNWALIVHRFGDAIKIPSFIGPLCIQSKETLACVGPIINN